MGFCAQINQPLRKSICATNLGRNTGKKQHWNDERNVDKIRWDFVVLGLFKHSTRVELSGVTCQNQVSLQVALHFCAQVSLPLPLNVIKYK